MLKRILLLLLFPVLLKAQSYPTNPVNYVTDEAGLLSQQQQEALNRKLKSFQDSTTNQIFIYITQSLNGNDLSAYTQDLFHSWKIGDKNKNNGVLIAIYVQDHKFRIHTGYGLEGVLPDLLTKKIQDETMRPYFKQNNYYTGIDKGVDELIYYCQHEFKSDTNAPVKTYWGSWLLGYSINVLLFLLLLYLLYGKKAKPRNHVKKTIWLVVGIIFVIFPCIGAIILFFICAFLAPWKLRSGSGGRSSYSSSGDSSWSSSDSSDSSSDFSGGGGGDSGGGGSNSDW